MGVIFFNEAGSQIQPKILFVASTLFFPWSTSFLSNRLWCDLFDPASDNFLSLELATTQSLYSFMLDHRSNRHFWILFPKIRCNDLSGNRSTLRFALPVR